MKYLIILQARMGSNRFPGKIMKLLGDKPVLIFQIEKLKKLNIPIVLATSTSNLDDLLTTVAQDCGIEIFRGSELDVFKRFCGVVKMFDSENYIRITADCPFLSINVINSVINRHETAFSDYTSNTLLRTFPKGLDVEIFTKNAFLKLMARTLTNYQKEHVTAGFYQNMNLFRCANIVDEAKIGDWRWTLDYESDLIWMNQILSKFPKNIELDYENLVKFLNAHPSLIRRQSDVNN